MGKPAGAILQQRGLNQIGSRREPPELKHLSRARKRNQKRYRKQWRANAVEAKPGVAIFLGLRTVEKVDFVRGTAWEGRSKSVRATYPKTKETGTGSRVPPDT